MLTLIRSVPATGRPARSKLNVRQRLAGRRTRRLSAQLKRAMRTAGYPALRRLDISFGDRQILLRGTVPSYFMKQIAQEIALRAAPAEEVRNEIEVDAWHYR